MKLFFGLITFALALVISAVAAYFSVVGLAALFAAAFWPVVIMGSALEAGKLVAATWLKFNWRNPGVGALHKTYLTMAVSVLMVITALGIYGFLAKGHLEQEAPLASVELQIARIEQRVSQMRGERDRLDVRLKQLDQSVDTILNNSKNTRDAQAALRARQQQQKERDQIRGEQTAKDGEINKLTDQLVPLRTAANDVSAKLGPVKYVAKLFGWTDPTTAVQLVILLIMFAFDPLAVVLLLSGAITMGEWAEQRRSKEVVQLPPPDDDVKDDDLSTEEIHEPIPLEEIQVQTLATEEQDKIEISMTPVRSDKETLIDILERNPQLLSMLAGETEDESPSDAEPQSVEVETETKIDKPVEAEVTSVPEPSNTPSTGFTAWAREYVRGGSK